MVPGETRIGKLEELSLEFEIGFRPGTPDDFQAFGENAKILGGVSRICRLIQIQGLAAVEPAADCAFHPPTGHVVEHREIFGKT